MKTILVLQRGWVVAGDLAEDSERKVMATATAMVCRGES